jgi:hypothetical protein
MMHAGRHASAILAILLLGLSQGSCGSVAQRAVTRSRIETLEPRLLDRLYFGRAMPGGGTVTDDAWRGFLRDVITPRFPDGLTVWHAEGQWRDDAGAIVREESFVLELIHPDEERFDIGIDEIIGMYREQFHQESVLRVRSEARVGF